MTTPPRKRPEHKKPYIRGHYGDEVVTTLEIGPREFRKLLFWRTPSEESPHDDGRLGVVLQCVPAIKYIDFAHFTVPELDMFKTFINEVLEQARATSQARDADVEFARQAGDIRNRRLYRPDPVRRDFPEPLNPMKDEQPDDFDLPPEDAGQWPE